MTRICYALVIVVAFVFNLGQASAEVFYVIPTIDTGWTPKMN